MGDETAPKVWWVNQGSTFRQSRAGGYLWAPIWDGNGIERAYWKTMSDVKEGDIIVHCTTGKIVALSIATSHPYQAKRPAEFSRPSELEALNWDSTSAGRRIEVTYHDLQPPTDVAAIAHAIASLDIEKGPLDKNFKPKQSYLHRFTIQGLRILRNASSAEWPEWAETVLNRHAFSS